MQSQLADVYNNHRSPNLKNSESVKLLQTLIGEELTRDSSADEVKQHIRRHFQNPNFDRTGMCSADIWKQDAHGYYTMFYPGRAMMNVNYFLGDGKFLFAAVSYDGLDGYLYLSEPVDVYDRRAWKQPEPEG